MKTSYILLIFLISVSIVNAQRISVPTDQASIQAAIETAAQGDTIVVEEGSYIENINFPG